MKRTILFLAVITCFLVFTGISQALTIDEAIADVENQTVQKHMTPKDAFMAVKTIERLTAIGVSVDNAYQLVSAAINKGIRAKELAPITRSIELVSPEAVNAVTTAATNAITDDLSVREIMDAVRAADN